MRKKKVQSEELKEPELIEEEILDDPIIGHEIVSNEECPYCGATEDCSCGDLGHEREIEDLLDRI